MAYIGVQPTAGQYRKLDNISASFNGSTTSFTTSVGGTNVTAGTAQQLIVSLGGVIQQPDTDYTVSTNTITFTTAPTSGLDFFAILMGDALNTVTPSDGSVTTSKLAGSLSVGLTAGSASTPALFFTGDTNNGIFSPSTDAIAVTTAGSERLRVTSAGLVGIGTSAPGYKTEISGTSGTAGLGLTGTYASGDIGYYFAPSAVTGSVKAFQSAASATTGVTALFANANSATGTAHARVEAEVGGSSAGDPKFVMTVSGATNWSVGVDNSDSDKFKISSSDSPGSSDRLTIDTSGNVGIGTTSPSAPLHINGTANNTAITLSVGGTVTGYIGPAGFIGGSDSNLGYRVESGNSHVFHTGATERARIDSSGRLLVGTSSASNTFTTALLQGNAADTTGDGVLRLARGAATPASGNGLGYIVFSDSGHVDAAYIFAARDGGTWSGSSKPTRLVFSVTSDGASSPTERVRLTNQGYLKTSNSGTYVNSSSTYSEFVTNAADHILWLRNTNGTNPYGLRIDYSLNANDTAKELIYCVTDTTLKMSLRSNGGITNYQANNVNLSDRNVKKDITPAAGTWDCIKEWEIVNYRYKDQPDDADLNLGVIAQQVAESCPEVITVFQEAKEATEDQPAQEERLGVKEQQMYWMAIKALQEAQVRIEALEAEVAALKAQ